MYSLLPLNRLADLESEQLLSIAYNTTEGRCGDPPSAMPSQALVQPA